MSGNFAAGTEGAALERRRAGLETLSGLSSLEKAQDHGEANLKIIPHEGVGWVRFGMTRPEVERVMRRIPERGRRGWLQLSDYDFFESYLMFVYYDGDDKACAAEFAQGAEIEYESYRLFAHSARVVRDWARSRDATLEDKFGFKSRVLGLAMSAPGIDEEICAADMAQSFLVFRPKYYEDERERMENAFPELRKPRKKGLRKSGPRSPDRSCAYGDTMLCEPRV
jgi:hypothetical protein